MTKRFIFKLRYTLHNNLDPVAVILAKDIPTYKQVGSLVEIPLTEKNFNKYYDRFKFVVDKLLGEKDVILFHENIEVNGKFLQEFYVAINELRREDKLKRKNKNKKKSSNNILIEKKLPIPPINTDAKLTTHNPLNSHEKIGGVDKLIQTLKNTIELPLKTPELLSYLGVSAHKGILLYGESGCGKTLIAHTLKEQLNINFIEVSISDLTNKNCLVSLHEIYNDAIEKSPSIIYIDSLDSIAASRSYENKSSKVLIDLLDLLDKISDTDKVTILASTNRIDLIDPALLRSGRFDLKYKIEKPNEDSCYDIFTKITSSMPINNKFHKDTFSKKLVGLTGADIEFICREAAYNCIKRNIDLEIPLSVASAKTNTKLLINEDDFSLALNTLKHF